MGGGGGGGLYLRITRSRSESIAESSFTRCRVKRGPVGQQERHRARASARGAGRPTSVMILGKPSRGGMARREA